MNTIVTSIGADGLDDAMVVMRTAFDPLFGEAWTASQCAGVLSMPGADLLVARASSEPPSPVGFALLRTVVGEAELMLIAVAPEVRRQGLARRLLDDAMRQARDRAARRFVLEVRADNPALSIYQAAGLEIVGRRRDYYRGSDGRLRDALTLARDL